MSGIGVLCSAYCGTQLNHFPQHLRHFTFPPAELEMLIFPHPCQYLTIHVILIPPPLFFRIAFLLGVKCFATEVLICISLRIGGVDYLFMC